MIMDDGVVVQVVVVVVVDVAAVNLFPLSICK